MLSVFYIRLPCPPARFREEIREKNEKKRSRLAPTILYFAPERRSDSLLSSLFTFPLFLFFVLRRGKPRVFFEGSRKIVQRPKPQTYGNIGKVQFALGNKLF